MLQITIDPERQSSTDTTPRQLALRMLALVGTEAWDNEKFLLSTEEAARMISELAQLAKVIAFYAYLDANPDTEDLPDWGKLLHGSENVMDSSEAQWKEHHDD